ncbi:MAG: hypothetical protein ACOZJX_12915 [Pseudomonadota bacterium]
MDICLEQAPIVQSDDTHQRFALRFQSLFNQGRAMVFPCNAQGQVDLDALSDRARENYLYARAVVGFEYAAPAVTRDYSLA